ncbi:hypothetical protein RND81_04G057100 [Saponaria officinalis]|uniref:Reverse transcriptase zinc-binding domain-containing protein n=1 Tax=Saponaria officinalis TaxID=3572 RepID=A0AAW1LI20_SAPOF
MGRFRKTVFERFYSICQDKNDGGHGIIKDPHWNIASIGKYAWWVMAKKDHLWVKWVHSIYLKGGDWGTYQRGASWAWRRIFWVKEQFLEYNGFLNISGTAYQTRSRYDWLWKKEQQVTWHKLVWSRLKIQKHAFICWLVMRKRLHTYDRMKRMGIGEDDMCPICADDNESHEHLFFLCNFSSSCLQLVSSSCGIMIPRSDWEAWWRKSWFRSIIRKKIIGMLLCSLTYLIWWARNRCVHDRVFMRPEWLVQQMRFMVAIRVQKNIPFVKRRRHETWKKNVLGDGYSYASL